MTFLAPWLLYGCDALAVPVIPLFQRLTDFNNPLSRRQHGNDLRQRPFESAEQRGVDAIRQANPDQLQGLSRSQREGEEVFILTNDNPRFRDCEFANRSILGLRESHVENMHRIMPLPSQPARERCGQLIIDHKPHVACTTT